LWSDWGGLTGPALVLEDTLGAFNRAKQPLIRCRRLHDQHRLPIDRQHRRPAAALEPLQLRLGMAVKIRKRFDVLDSDSASFHLFILVHPS